MHRMGVLVALLAAGLVLSGCLASDEGGSPNLRTPRLVVDVTPDNLTTFYVHSAFASEHVYDDIALALDNETVQEENHTYALLHKSNRSAFFLSVHVRDEGDLFRYAARLEANATADVLAVAAWDAEDRRLGAADNATLPFKKVVPSYDPTTVTP